MLTRRSFLGLTSTAFMGLALDGCATTPARSAAPGYGPLVPDPAGLFDLPAGFSYRIISSYGDAMSDGLIVPDRADGMGAFRLDSDRVTLVRNHELAPRHRANGAFGASVPVAPPPAFDHANGAPLPGGTTTLIYNLRTGQVERQHLSLSGTNRNCAGGVTPWGSWLTCEEDVTRAGENGQARDHGWVFEIPARAAGVTAPVPLTALGRFYHEAAAVDPRTGIVYLTEDREDGLFYRMLPHARGRLVEGGTLQALSLPGIGDTSNWTQAALPLRQPQPARWVGLDAVDSPDGDDLRMRGRQAGATIFTRGEGIYFGDGELFFTCTSGGAAKLGQIMRYRPSRLEGQAGEAGEPGRLELFVESADPQTLHYGDNLVVAPNGHLIVCEDQAGNSPDNYLRGVTPDGALYPFARLHAATELAGACFAPDGSTMFVNIFSPAKTLAITGPWRA